MKKNKIIYYVDKTLDIQNSRLYKKVDGKYYWFDSLGQNWDSNIDIVKSDLKVVRLDTYLKSLNNLNYGYDNINKEYDDGIKKYFKKEFYKQVLDE